ncbi:type I-F CRISPR-associated helicase Cas3f [Psychrobacter raelei]|uniref:type I-F CRISPR-associated helicase Cas3f n=1 Tax=Psychrobacter raelei TaxID=2565531 RepID=UPI003F637E07
MLVTFVSQCEKKALKRTRRILDAFANRIGDNVWQTAITEEGLTTVKRLLRQSATRSTAVSCHRVRTRQRTELVWIVGNKRKFNEVGFVPVNWTEDDVSIYQDSHEWKSLPLIQHASAIAGLFHDFGKANKLFQDKINPEIKTETFEPYRHEWISVRLFEAFVGDNDDAAWLNRLVNGDFADTTDVFRDGIDKSITKSNNPLVNLPPLAQLVAWLIVTHHKLPTYPEYKDGFDNEPSFIDISHWFKSFRDFWNSPNCLDENQASRIKDNWSFSDDALPYHSHQWRSRACDVASDAKADLLPFLSSLQKEAQGNLSLINDRLFSTHLSRLALMMADHYVSSLSFDTSNDPKHLGKYRDDNYKVYANTGYDEAGKKVYKQQLDQHLIGVGYEARKISKQLPQLKRKLYGLESNDFLGNTLKQNLKEEKLSKDKSEQLFKKFRWQDDAQNLAESIGEQTKNSGFFGINMASTGSGKTLCNAKIMYAIGQKTGKVRFNVALGLRTLTLQTGREFQKVMKLNEDELSIAVGGIAVKALFENQQNKYTSTTASDEKEADNAELMGSESADDFINPELYLDYQGKIQDHSLSKWTKDKPRVNKLLLPPVLVCTIDHLIPATEGIRGGQQIAPMLRLLTSDLILDEPDDFGLSDLPALCRLIHWSAMLGSRVLLSTATMPPALVCACFEAYKMGWRAYAKANIADWDKTIQCAWFDETQQPIEQLVSFDNFKDFKNAHDKFVTNRINQLKKMPPKRLGKIAPIIEDKQLSVNENMANTIFNEIIALHQTHRLSRADKAVSIGLVRMANIDPLIQVVKHLLAKDAPSDTCIHYCIYHSRFPLAIRSHIEDKLDNILTRKDPERIWHDTQGVGSIIKETTHKHHIFVVLASPVAEVGRDHDYDWAVVEPSSIRSMVQLAGRVLRHRDMYPTSPNISLLNKNIKALKNNEVCFTKPGFEGNGLELSQHDLIEVLEQTNYQTIDATPKLLFPENFTPQSDDVQNLNELEHKALYKKLLKDTSHNQQASNWWKHSVQWSGEVQRQQKFRKSVKGDSYHLWLTDTFNKPTFKWADPKEFDPTKRFHDAKNFGTEFTITDNSQLLLGSGIQFWFDLTPLPIYQNLINDFANQEKNYSLEDISRKFGEIKPSPYHTANVALTYQYQLGLY